MQCPECNDDLVILEVDDVELDLCYDGHGTWFDAQELEALFQRAGMGDAGQRLESELAQTVANRGRRRCPRCGLRMQQVRMDSSSPVLDRCAHGHGLWFDPGELTALVNGLLPADNPALQVVHEYLGRFFPRDAVAHTEVKQ